MAVKRPAFNGKSPRDEIPFGREQELKPATVNVTGAGETSVCVSDPETALSDPDYGAVGGDGVFSDLSSNETLSDL